jgi:hypothetical protein
MQVISHVRHSYYIYHPSRQHGLKLFQHYSEITEVQRAIFQHELTYDLLTTSNINHVPSWR